MKQSEIAKETGMSPGQVNHWINLIKDAVKNFASLSGEESLLDTYRSVEKRTKEPTKPRGPSKAFYVGPTGEDRIPVVIIRRGSTTVRIKREDGTPFDDGEMTKPVPVSQIISE